MSMNGADLGDAIRAAIADIPENERSDRERVFRAFGNAIVTYINLHAEVTVDVPGVASGASVAIGTGLPGCIT